MAQKFYVVGRRSGGESPHRQQEYPLRLIRKLDADGNRPEFGWREAMRANRRTKAHHFDSREKAESIAKDTIGRLQQTVVSRIVAIEFKVLLVKD